jgi:hypothetical protein
MKKGSPLVENALQVSDQPGRTVDEVPLGPARVQQPGDIHGRAGEVAELAAGLEADTEGRADVDDSLAQSHRGAKIPTRGVSQFDCDAPQAADAARKHLGVEGLDAVAGEAEGILDVKHVPVCCV